MTKVGLLVLSSALAAACAPTGRDLEPLPEARLIGGDPTPEGALSGTVAIAPRPSSCEGCPVDGMCTAARVGERALLVAAHCVIDPASVDPLWRPGDTISLMEKRERGFKSVVVEAVHAHPRWLAACGESYCAASSVTAKIDAPDVAVLVLRDAPEHAEIVPVSRARLAEGDEVVATGFGCTENVNARDERAFVALAHKATEIVSFAAAMHEGSPITEVDAPAASIYALTLGPAASDAGAGLCPGDSGGPLYRWTADGLRVVGVNANYTFVPEEDARHGLPVTNWHTRLDDHSRHDVGGWLRSLGIDVR